MKRAICTIKQYDYTSKQEFEKDVIKMKSKGYDLIQNGMCNGAFDPCEVDSEVWKYTACFIKSDMM